MRFKPQKFVIWLLGLESLLLLYAWHRLFTIDFNVDVDVDNVDKDKGKEEPSGRKCTSGQEENGRGVKPWEDDVKELRSGAKERKDAEERSNVHWPKSPGPTPASPRGRRRSRTIYVVTPTHSRPAQMADLTRMSQTLRLVSGIHWVVAEDANRTSFRVAEFLSRSGVRYQHLAATKPDEYRNRTAVGKGVFNRRVAIQWIRKHGERDAVLYLGDDDNSYDVRLFDEIRWTRKVSVFPVGLVQQYGISSPIVDQRRKNKVVGFHDAFQGGRRFAVDMAGFALNTSLLHAFPNATMPWRISYLEDGFLRAFNLTLDDLEPVAQGCTQVLVWHTRTQGSPKPKVQHLAARSLPVPLSQTNLLDLYATMLW